MSVEIALEIWERKKKVFENYKEIAKKIKEAAKIVLNENVRVIVFGSVVKKSYTPLSDLDILIISEKADKVNYGEVISKIKELVKKDLIGVEFHLVTPIIFENWYKKFLDKFEEI